MMSINAVPGKGKEFLVPLLHITFHRATDITITYGKEQTLFTSCGQAAFKSHQDVQVIPIHFYHIWYKILPVEPFLPLVWISPCSVLMPSGVCRL